MRALLDTCLLSELAKRRPDEGVLEWIGRQDERELHLSVLTLGELRRGARQVQDPVRRRRLSEWIERDVVERFRGRLLAVDTAVALQWGRIHADAHARGAVLPAVDALLAATARVHSLCVVTRNDADFAPAGVEVVNPWAPG